MRALTRADRNRLFASLQEWCSRRTVVALRTRALIALAADSGLRVGECVRLDMTQLLVLHAPGESIRISERFYLRGSQAKGGVGGMITVSPRARGAVRAYLQAVKRAAWIVWPPTAATPLFLGHRGKAGRPGHARLSVRAAQWSWHQAQRRAGLVDVGEDEQIKARYGFHTLRHDAATRLRSAGADLFDLQAQFRWKDPKHAQRYVHSLDVQRRLARLVKRASKG